MRGIALLTNGKRATPRKCPARRFLCRWGGFQDEMDPIDEVDSLFFSSSSSSHAPGADTAAGCFWLIEQEEESAKKKDHQTKWISFDPYLLICSDSHVNFFFLGILFRPIFLLFFLLLLFIFIFMAFFLWILGFRRHIRFPFYFWLKHRVKRSI